MLRNLKDHGSVFNNSNDKSYADDLLNLDISDGITVREDSLDKTFEDD